MGDETDPSIPISDLMTDYLRIFMRTVKLKNLSKKPAACSMGWTIYYQFKIITEEYTEEQLWEDYWKVIMRELPK